MDGHSRGSAGGDAAVGVEMGGTLENCGPTGRPDDRLGVRTRFGFLCTDGTKIAAAPGHPTAENVTVD